MANFSEWIAKLFSHRDLLRMGHAQRLDDLNLGLGWLYYGLVRTIRPRRVVVIGSFRGFVPLVMGKAIQENLEGGEVLFIDPSFVDDFWKDPTQVKEYFESFDVSTIRHVLMTTQEFVASVEYQSLGEVGMVFIDGYHTFEQAKFDYLAFRDRLTPDGVILLHDTLRNRTSRIYGAERVYEHHVKDFIEELKRDATLQVLDLPFGDGVTLVRRATA